MSSLSKQQCEPYTKDSKPLNPDTAKVLLKQLNADWSMGENENSIVRDFAFANYYETIAFVNAVAWVSHQQDHHPSLVIEYKSCRIEYTTHHLNGLSINDFICASKIDTIKQPEISDPELQSSDQPRRYATEAIKLSELEQDIELDYLREDELVIDESPSSIAPDFDEEDEPIFNNDGEIIIEPQTTKTTAKPSYIDTQTLIMTQEELQKLSAMTAEAPAIEEEEEEDVGDITIPDRSKPTAPFSEPMPTTTPQSSIPVGKEAQTVIMSLADLNQAQETLIDNSYSSDNEKTVIMPPPIIENEVGNDFDTDESNAQDTQEVDPAIENDDTLVMHANTYERVNK